MKFGIFDHMDRGHGSLGEQYEERLRLLEAYDRVGIHAYHLAEHHANPVGLAPSPSVFLAAAAQRTKRLRFGPLVYTLALYHPLRLLEEICMLDQMSGGRLELGIGRGVSPMEQVYWGNDPEQAQGIYTEVLDIVLRGLGGGTLSFAGKYFNFTEVPLELQAVQRPHPPLWYGVAHATTIPWAVAHDINAVIYGNATQVRQITDLYRAEWQRAGKDPAKLPFLGMNRHMVVADTNAEALAIARRAYPKWYQSLMTLWFKAGKRSENIAFPDNFDRLQEMGLGIAGSAATVRDYMLAEVAQSGITYPVFRLAYGDLTLAESQRSLELLAKEVLPALAEIRPAA